MLHYQFEAIHPFGDGNGRVGRMLAVLYLVLQKKISLPILFLSEHIIYNKNDYYDFLQAMDENKENALYDFTSRFLILIETQAYKTTSVILSIENLMLQMKIKMKEHPKLSKIYRHELINYLFTRPYYSIE
jgi:Fic family protein